MLERAFDLAEEIFGRVSAETFRLRDDPATETNALVDSLTRARDMIQVNSKGPENASSAESRRKRTRKITDRGDWFLDDAFLDRFTKELVLARISLGWLRRPANTRTAAGTAVRDDLDTIANQLSTIEGTLTLVRDSAQHPVNTFNGRAFCPDLRPAR